jgi:hypothetical protein
MSVNPARSSAAARCEDPPPTSMIGTDGVAIAVNAFRELVGLLSYQLRCSSPRANTSSQ